MSDNDKRNGRSKDSKYYDGGKKPASLPIECVECGKRITPSEEKQNEGLCTSCWETLVGK